jgi:hypothetical protein
MINDNDALDLLELVETAARFDVSPEELKRHAGASIFNKLAADLEYFKEKAASSKWSSGFKTFLKGTISIELKTLSREEKEKARRGTRCMACGTEEQNNVVAVSLFGNVHDTFCRPTSPFADLETLSNEVDVYLDNIQSVFEEAEATKTTRGKPALNWQDRGVLLLGSDCHERLKLFFLVNTFIGELAYAASVHAESVVDEVPRHMRGDTKLFSNTQEDVDLLCGSLKRMRELVALETGKIEEKCIPIDSNYCQAVKKLRQGINLQCLVEHARACIVEAASGNNEGVPRKRTVVVDDDSSSDDEVVTKRARTASNAGPSRHGGDNARLLEDLSSVKGFLRGVLQPEMEATVDHAISVIRRI